MSNKLDIKRVTLPREILDKLDIKGNAASRRPRPGTQPRKALRKSARVDKKSRAAQARVFRKQHLHQEPAQKPKPALKPRPGVVAKDDSESVADSGDEEDADDVNLDVSTSGDENEDLQPPPAKPRASRNVQAKLDEEDQKIRLLEKKLGLKGKKKSTKADEDDGLDGILEGIGGSDMDESPELEDSEAQTWLRKKRQAAKERHLEAPAEDDAVDSDFSGFQESEDDAEADSSPASDMMDVDENGAFTPEPESPRPKKTRENPYRPPVSSSKATSTPNGAHTRASLGEEEISDQLKRKVKGLLNRLSEANILPILAEVDALYRDNARQHVSTALMEALLSHFDTEIPLEDTFIILHGGFTAGLDKTIGPDFGAEIVKRITERLDAHIQSRSGDGAAGKLSTNLIALLTELYNFRVISSDLVYDFVRVFVNELSERNTELLLKVVKASGPQLRQEDPSALKDIVLTLQSTVSKVGLSDQSVRTRFMVDTIMDLKNNRLKSTLQTSGLALEHRNRLKKSLGSIPLHKVKAHEPLRITLSDIRNSESKGKWWVVGARYTDEKPENTGLERKDDTDSEASDLDGGDIDIAALAKTQRMNTEVRRAIFVSIMSASDYQDANQRLVKLRLKKSQESEIPKVLVQCVTSEQAYNPYYVLIAGKLCDDKRMRMSFQFTLWDTIKALEEGQEDEEEAPEQSLDVRAVVHLGKMYGHLVADLKLDIKVAKNIDVRYISEGDARHVFLEVFLVSVILQCCRGGEEQAATTLRQVFSPANELPDFALGLRQFLGSTVKHTDVATKKAQRKVVRAGCKLAEQLLSQSAGEEGLVDP